MPCSKNLKPLGHDLQKLYVKLDSVGGALRPCVYAHWTFETPEGVPPDHPSWGVPIEDARLEDPVGVCQTSEQDGLRWTLHT